MSNLAWKIGVQIIDTPRLGARNALKQHCDGEESLINAIAQKCWCGGQAKADRHLVGFKLFLSCPQISQPLIACTQGEPLPPSPSSTYIPPQKRCYTFINSRLYQQHLVFSVIMMTKSQCKYRSQGTYDDKILILFCFQLYWNIMDSLIFNLVNCVTPKWASGGKGKIFKSFSFWHFYIGVYEMKELKNM